MPLNNVKSLKCLICGKRYHPDDISYVCPDHGDDGILDVEYDYEYIQNNLTQQDLASSFQNSVWRYKALLPISEKAVIPALPVGWTPLISIPDISSHYQLNSFHLKDEGRQPTASFKDRASSLAVVKAMEKQASFITTASTGNAAAALSGFCASVGQPNIIFVPESAPQAKIAQLLVFGSTVMLVKGTYDDAFDLCLKAADHYGWYNRNTGYNPYMTEGKKTVSYEICEQLNWQAPDRIFVSVGDGCIIGGVYKGLKDLMKLGWIDKMPKLVGVQAEGSSYLAQAWKNGEDVLTKPPAPAVTVADSISASLPRDRIKAMAAVNETGGCFMTVSDYEILSAITKMARATGVFGEPAGAAAFAGFESFYQQNSEINRESVVVINTGNGLKDINSALKSVELSESQCFNIESDFSQFKAIMSDNHIVA